MNSIDMIHEHLLKSKVNGVFRENDKIFVLHLNRPGRPFDIMEFSFEDTIVIAKSQFVNDLVFSLTNPDSLPLIDLHLSRAVDVYNSMIWHWEKFGAVLTQRVYGIIVTYSKYTLYQS